MHKTMIKVYVNMGPCTLRLSVMARFILDEEG
jgi:hypothetical protein